jgi:hypothetical protein
MCGSPYRHHALVIGLNSVLSFEVQTSGLGSKLGTVLSRLGYRWLEALVERPDPSTRDQIEQHVPDPR